MLSEEVLEAILLKLPFEKIQELRTINLQANVVFDKHASFLPGKEMGGIRIICSKKEDQEHFSITGREKIRLLVSTKIVHFPGVDDEEDNRRFSKNISSSEIEQHLYLLRPSLLRLTRADLLRSLDSNWWNQIEHICVDNVDSEDFAFLKNIIKWSNVTLTCNHDGMDLDSIIRQMPAIEKLLAYANYNCFYQTSDKTLEMLSNKSLLSTGIIQLFIKNKQSNAFAQEDVINFFKTVKLTQTVKFCHISFSFVRGRKTDLNIGLRQCAKERNWSYHDSTEGYLFIKSQKQCHVEIGEFVY